MFDYIEPEMVLLGKLRTGYSSSGWALPEEAGSITSAGDSAAEFHQSYSVVSLEELRQRIELFESRPQGTLTEDELRNGVYNTVGTGNRGPLTFAKSGMAIAEGTSFFRARYISDPSKQLLTTGDVWEPKPEQVTKTGRLNALGEPILYTSLGTPVTAVMECRFEVNDVFAMSRFEARTDFRSTFIGLDPLLPHLGEEDRAKVHAIQSFLDRSFSYTVGPENLDAYRLSRLLALEFWDLPPQEVDGWAFRSIMDSTERGWNFSFIPNVGRRALRYKETHLYCLSGFDKSGTRPKAELLAAFRAARNDKLSPVSSGRLHTISPWL